MRLMRTKTITSMRVAKTTTHHSSSFTQQQINSIRRVTIRIE
jgi:hypothetical protein